jgi:hypothetical protein
MYLRTMRPEDDVLVLGGGPEGRLKPEVGAVAVGLGGGFLSTWHIAVNIVAESGGGR